MKAKDYAKQYNESENKHTAAADIARAFLTELVTINEKRGCQRNSACIGVIKELDQKWRVFAKLTDVNPNGFKEILETYTPELKGIL